MFTGIISSIGTVQNINPSRKNRYEFLTKFNTSNIEIGSSIACSGVCLTVVETGPNWFAVNVSEETIMKTTINSWQIDKKVNFEKALKIGDELGGHLVSGHVDGCGLLTNIEFEENSTNMTFKTTKELSKSIAKKGSITIDGVSLTVTSVSDHFFSTSIIPHTIEKTTLGGLKKGDSVNLEIDLIARYVAQLLGKV